jgi:cytochrome P450
MKQFPWLVHVLSFLPQKWIARLSPDFGLILGYQDVRVTLPNTVTVSEVFANHIQIARQHVLKIRSGTDTDEKYTHSIFHTLIDSELSASDKGTERLAKEGFVIVAAGGDTTGATISLILFHLIDNPEKLARLRTE